MFLRVASLSPIGVSGDKTHDYWLICENDVMELVRQEYQFIISAVLFLLLIVAVMSVIGMLVIRLTLTQPIIRLKNNATKFASENSAERTAEPVDPGIRSNDELEALSSAIFKMETNVKETQEELKSISEERGRMHAQLSIATAIQQGVLPTDFPNDSKVEVFALMAPAKEVGGDFYDCFFIDDTHLGLVIGDVSDKGIPASLFMMTSKTLIKSQALSGYNPADTLKIVNNHLCSQNPAEMFVTVWMGILDLTTGVIQACNGGHEYPIIKLGEGPFEVFKDKHGAALGLFENLSYTNYELHLHPGDRLVVYSDGATDAIDADEKSFGLDNLLKTVIEASEDPTSKGIVEKIKARLDEYSKDTYQFDDITLMSVRIHQLEKTDDTGTKDSGSCDLNSEA